MTANGRHLEIFPAKSLGGCSHVVEGLLCRKETNERESVAVKIFSESSFQKKFNSEYQIMQKLSRFENVVHYYDYAESKMESNSGYIVMELCLGTLLDVIEGRISLPNPEEVDINDVKILCFKQVLIGLDQLSASEADAAHRDIKPNNIFFTKGRNGKLITKLGDFGISKEFCDSCDKTTFTHGHENYLAPELMECVNKKLKLTPKGWHRADIFALGCSIYELFYKKHLYDHGERFRITANILDGNRRFETQLAKRFRRENELKEILKDMTNHDPSQRPTANTCLGYDLFKDGSNTINNVIVNVVNSTINDLRATGSEIHL